jgi:hypothetical protein
MCMSLFAHLDTASEPFRKIFALDPDRWLHDPATYKREKSMSSLFRCNNAMVENQRLGASPLLIELYRTGSFLAR